MRNGLKICLSAAFLLSLLNFAGCLSTMETAKIKKGFNNAVSVDIIRIDNDEEHPHFDEGNYTHLSTTWRPSYGFMLGDNFGFEAGFKIGTYEQSKVGGELVKGGDGRWQKTYIPFDKYYSSTVKQYLKIGFMQSKKIMAAGIAEFAGADPAVFGVIVSKEGNSISPYISFKTFNRFIAPAEKGLPEDSWGKAISVGIEKKTDRTLVGTRQKIDLLVELGLLRDYWYHDSNTLMLGVGIALRK